MGCRSKSKAYLTLTTLLTNSADDTLMLFFFLYFSPENKLRRQFALKVKAHSMGKIRKKIFQNVVC